MTFLINPFSGVTGQNLTNAVIAEIFYVVIGIVFILVGLKALRDSAMQRRIPTALFWFILAATFIVGPYVPNWITGLMVVAIAAISAFRGVRQSKSDVATAEQTRERANKLGYWVFVPALALALVAFAAAMWLPYGANNAIGISAVVALIAALVLTKSGPGTAMKEGTRLMDNVGSAGILPQVLAALGAVFTAAGVGDVIARGVSVLIPDGSRLVAVVVYCVSMAVFTIIMGNGFAAFSVITVGIGIPFLIMQGANPIVVGALGLTAGYCGTLCTPMAANFNIMPAALLETKDKYVIIKSQLPVAAVLLCAHIVLMYAFAF